MNRKQRIHSAELRRLDHIARSLDRIGEALEHLRTISVVGNNDIVGSNLNQSQTQIGGEYNSQTQAGRDNRSIGSNSGYVTQGDKSVAAQSIEEVDNSENKKDIATYGENSQGVVDGAVDYNQSPNKLGTG